MCLFCLAGPSRRFDSGCLWAGLASLRVPPPCSIVRALHQHKLGTAAWPSLQQVRRFLAEELKGLHGAFFFFFYCWMVQNQMLGWFSGSSEWSDHPHLVDYWALSHVEVPAGRSATQKSYAAGCPSRNAPCLLAFHDQVMYIANIFMHKVRQLFFLQWEDLTPLSYAGVRDWRFTLMF